MLHLEPVLRQTSWSAGRSREVIDDMARECEKTCAKTHKIQHDVTGGP